MTATTASKGQRVSDLLARLGAQLGAPQVTLNPGECDLAREALCLLARQHAVASRPHAVVPLHRRDRAGRPVTAANDGSYPLHATCGICGEDVYRASAAADWYHLQRAAGWPVQPLVTDERGGRQRDGACPEHGDRCPHL